jgi:glycosyltransferase involved in cell wall biosynthesis
MKRWLAARLPGLQRALHTLDGRTLDRIDRAQANAADAAWLNLDFPPFTASGLEVLDAADRTAEIAWIGPGPFDETGLGAFSRAALLAAPVAVDWFVHPSDPPSALAWAERLAREGPHRMLPLSLAPLAAGRRRYRAVIVSLANSHHNLPALHALRRLAALGVDSPLWAYVHDPVVLNLLWLASERDDRRLAAVLRRDYGAARVGPAPVGPFAFSRLILAGVFGLRTLLGDLPLARVLVNSAFAADMAQSELAGLDVRHGLDAVFHPVFPSVHSRRLRNDGLLRIGTFGAPGTAKQTDKVIAAAARLRAQGDNVRLMIAGYGAAEQRDLAGPGADDWIECAEPRSQEDLDALIAQVDVCVQLRKEALGESSGVVAQAIALDVPLVATRIGAFAELDHAVAFVSPECSESELAAAIRRTAAEPPPGMAAYRESRSPAVFWRRLLAERA